MLKNKTIAFIGAGSIAESMIAGLANAGELPGEQIKVTNRSNQERLQELQRKYGVKGVQRDALDFHEMDIIILAMKPKDVLEPLQFLKGKISSRHIVLSVLAGISTDALEKNLPIGTQVFRVMPNTSSMIGESATAVTQGQYVDANTMEIVKELLSCMGQVYTIDEGQMDIFTGIAGSGPAYFYYLMEHIEKAGREGGLDQEIARQIGVQTILGAAKMMMEQPVTPLQLREKVTSPNGTTAAGLAALKKHGGGNAMFQAVKGAARRSKEMSLKLQEEIF